MKKDRKTQAQMLILPTRAALNVAVSTVWDKYDAPAWKRAGKPDPMRHSNASARKAVAEHTSPTATESAATGASELRKSLEHA